MRKAALAISPAQASDLAAINDIVSACVMGWNLPQRVKRLAVNSYQYNTEDLAHQDIYVARGDGSLTLGVGALEAASATDLPANHSGLLLHGLFIKPEQQQQGIGRSLLTHALQQVHQLGLNGLLVKAQTEANSYFARQGFSRMPVIDPDRDYPHRWWKPV